MIIKEVIGKITTLYTENYKTIPLFVWKGEGSDAISIASYGEKIMLNNMEEAEQLKEILDEFIKTQK